MRAETHKILAVRTNRDSMDVRKTVNSTIFSHPVVGAAGSTTGAIHGLYGFVFSGFVSRVL